MRKAAVFLVPALVLLLAGCQAIFTFSPLSGLKRDPSTMSPEQRLTYAQDALASGDTAAMQKAYDAIKNDTSGQAQYTAAQLGIEISGVPTILREIASDPSTVTTQLNAIDSFITSHNLDPNFMVAAAGQLINAAAAGVPLTTMDYAMGAMGIMLGGAKSLNGNWNFSGLGGTGAQLVAVAFLAPAVSNVVSLPSGDPLKDFITQLNNYISNPTL
jgi:hypothetical protein